MRRHHHEDRANMGFCSVHNKRRKVAELMPVPGQPGQFRCHPQRECFQRELEMVVCAVHGRRRVKGQCNQVSDTAYECKPEYPCRVAGVGGARREHGGGGANAEQQQQQAAGGGSSAPPAPPSHLPPTSNFRTAPGGGPAPLVSSVGATALGSMVLDGSADEVWCASHGKRLPTTFCQLVEGTFYSCMDATACTSSALEAPSALHAKGCDKLVCTRHGRLRRSQFMQLDPDMGGYTCSLAHRCVLRRGRQEMTPGSGDEDEGSDGDGLAY